MEDKIWFSAAEIAELGKALIGGLPKSTRGALGRAKDNQWGYRIVHGKGGKGGLKTEYKLPQQVMKVVRMFLNENPDFFEKDKKETASSKPYPVSTAKPLPTVGGQHSSFPAQNHSTTDIKVNDFFMMPKNDLRSTDEGHGHVIRSEQIVDHLAFKKEWLQMSLNVHNNRLALITVKGDSMEPTLRSDDLILTDISTAHIEDDSIYVLQFKNDLVLKRIQRKMNGSVVVKSDNPIYGQEEMDELSAQALPVVGRVIWYGRRI